MNSDVSVVLGVAAIVALTVLGLAVVFRGGKLRATRKTLEITSDHVKEK